jgi:hypothetical protein
MFTPNQEQAAAELVRVVRIGGKIGLAQYYRGGFHFPVQVSRTLAPCISQMLWSNEPGIHCA